MTISHDTTRYQNTTSHSAVDSGPTFSGLDIPAGILVLLMIIGPLSAGATHASHQGWPTEQTQTR